MFSLIQLPMEALAGEYIEKKMHVVRFPQLSLVCKLVQYFVINRWCLHSHQLLLDTRIEIYMKHIQCDILDRGYQTITIALFRKKNKERNEVTSLCLCCLNLIIA